MRWSPALLCLAWAACHRAPALATGSLTAAPGTVDDSTSLAVKAMVADYHLSLLEKTAGVTLAQRRGNALIFEVTVRGSDGRRAVEQCDQVIRGYVEKRRQEAGRLVKVELLEPCREISPATL